MFKNILKAAGDFVKSLFGFAPSTSTPEAQAPGQQATDQVAQPAVPGAITTPETVLEADVQHAIDLVNNVKTALASPVAVLITTLIPGTLDDSTREVLVTTLPRIAAGLTFFEGMLETSDKSAQFNSVLANIKFSAKPNIDAFYHTLAAKVLTVISDGKVSWPNAVLAVEYYFTNILNAPAPAVVAEPVVEAPAVAIDAPAPLVAAPVVASEPVESVAPAPVVVATPEAAAQTDLTNTNQITQ